VTAGEGEPVLLLHKAPLSHAEYLDVISILARHYRVIAWDAPGHGSSYIPPREYEFLEYISALHELVTALSLEDVHLAGVHSGAARLRRSMRRLIPREPERSFWVGLGSILRSSLV
jgi:pimeloyl-ACP methyl ester carboxylesterase